MVESFRPGPVLPGPQPSSDYYFFLLPLHDNGVKDSVTAEILINTGRAAAGASTEADVLKAAQAGGAMH